MNQEDETRQQPGPEIQQMKPSDSNTHPGIGKTPIDSTTRKGTLINSAFEMYHVEIIDSGITTPESIGVDDDYAYSWPETTPLPDALPKVQKFDPELLPIGLRGWIMDISHRMQCPPDFSAVAAIAAVSSVIGARAVIKPKAQDDWAVVPNLWALVVGRPGIMKSPAIDEVIKPLTHLEDTERTQWQKSKTEYEIDVKFATLTDAYNEKKAKKIVSSDPNEARALLQSRVLPEEPQQRRFIINDSTVEKLGEILAVNPWGTLAYRDELYGLLTSLDKQGQEGSRAFYLSGYDGNKSHTSDRIIRGETHIQRVCIAMLGGIPPGRVQQYVRGAVAGGAADDGLLQRFGLTVWPDVVGDFLYVDEWPDIAAKTEAWAIFQRLADLQPADLEQPQVWRYSPAAQALFVDWYTEMRTELRRGEHHPALESHLAKYAKLIPALSLIFALVDTPDAGGVIHETEIIRAFAWGEYLRSHATRLYSSAGMPELSTAHTLLKKIQAMGVAKIDGSTLTSFAPRQLAAKGWAGLNSPEDVRKAAHILTEYGWLRKEVVRSSDPFGRGRDGERYLIHPELLRHGNKL